jgi:hypothetical protein
MKAWSALIGTAMLAAACGVEAEAPAATPPPPSQILGAWSCTGSFKKNNGDYMITYKRNTGKLTVGPAPERPTTATLTADMVFTADGKLSSTMTIKQREGQNDMRIVLKSEADWDDSDGLLTQTFTSFRVVTAAGNGRPIDKERAAAFFQDYSVGRTRIVNIQTLTADTLVYGTPFGRQTCRKAG